MDGQLPPPRLYAQVQLRHPLTAQGTLKRLHHEDESFQAVRESINVLRLVEHDCPEVSGGGAMRSFSRDRRILDVDRSQNKESSGRLGRLHASITHLSPHRHTARGNCPCSERMGRDRRVLLATI